MIAKKGQLKVVGVRIPPELDRKIEKQVAKLGVKKQFFIQRAIEACLEGRACQIGGMPNA